MPGADRLHVKIVTKYFGARTVLENIEFSARPGEVLALLAPSGTGKTTVLRIVLGLDKKFSGNVVRPEGRLGAVFQEPRLLPWLNVSANLRLVAPQLGDAEIGTLLTSLGLAGCEQRLPKEISLGMARRVALARALAVRPNLLVMDEPFASLDARLGAELGAGIAARTRGAGTIVLLSTHDLHQALSIVDRVLVLGGAPATLEADILAADITASALRSRFPFLEAAGGNKDENSLSDR
jgi:ABC-type nitrate/sulfonate/bicarbonate transport system ATPase subunit